MHDDNRPPRPQVTLHQGRARPASATPRSPTHIALKALAARYQDLDDKVGELDAAIGAILEEVAPLLLEEKCVSSQGTVQLMIRVGDNPERLKQRVVVLLCGVAARPASSELTTLHRLNRGAGRAAANSAIHIVAPGRLRTDDRTRA